MNPVAGPNDPDGIRVRALANDKNPILNSRSRYAPSCPSPCFVVGSVCEWIGNTPKIALDHYVQVTDEDFALAVSGDTTLTLGASQSASLMGCNSLQGEKPKCEKLYKARFLQSGAIPCKEVGMGDTGFEPVTSAV